MTPDLGSPRQEDQFREFVGVLKRRKGMVLAGLAACLALGVVSILLSTPSYEVVTRVLIQNYSDGSFRAASSPVDRMSQIGSPPEIGGQIGLIGSQPVLADAFSRANVNIPTEGATDRILAVRQENTTPVLDIEVNLPDGDAATRLAQAIPAAYNDYVRKNDADKLKTTIDTAKARADAARADLTKAQTQMETFLANQGTTSVAAGVNEGAQRTERLTNFESQLESAKVGLQSAQSGLQAALDAQGKIPALTQDVQRRPSIEPRQNQLKVIADLTSELNAALVTNTESSPNVRELRARLREQQSYLAKIPTQEDRTGTVRNAERAIYDQRVAEARQQVASRQSEVEKLTGIVAAERSGLNAYQKRLPRQRELESAVEEKRQAVFSVNQQLAEVQSVGSSSRQAVQVVAPPSAPVKTQPAITRTLVASTLLGIVFGIVAALMRDRFDNRIQTIEQIYDASGAVPIGQVPVGGKALSLQSGAGRNRILESYRSLRYNLESNNEGGVVQSVLVSSASAGEGRAALSLNLATEAATDLRKTILVDGDMRTPDLHERFRVSRGPGLSDVLSGTVALADVLKETGTEGLLFLPAGTEHNNPLELLSGPSMASTHEALKEMADVIIFNSPSLMRYTDARALAKVTDSAVFVAKRGFTRRDAMRYCVGMLRRAKASFLGVVLVDESGGRTSDVPYFATE